MSSDTPGSGLEILEDLERMMDNNALAHEVESHLRDKLPELRAALSETEPQFVVCSDKGVVQNIQYEGTIYVPSAIGPSRKLRTEVLNAINKLENLGNTFSSTNFTDRYGDGPHCLDLAKRLKEALNGQ